MALAAVVACGKRGPPLPPLRPVPAAAESVTVRQVGNRIRVEWRAPSRNADGTTEKFDLSEVEIRRRIIDLPALIEEQTEIVEPEESAEEEVGEAGETPVDAPPGEVRGEEAAMLEEAAPGELTGPTTDELAPGEEAPEATLPVPGDELSEVGLPGATGPPPSPMLDIPSFAPNSRPVVTLDSMQPDEARSYEDEIDPAWIGKRIEYAVVYINQKNRRGPRSTVVQIDPAVELDVPGQPVAEAKDGFVSVVWPALAAAGGEGEGEGEAEKLHFSVFRRAEDASDYPDRPIHAVPLSGTEFEDRSAVFGVPSCYMVRTVPAPPPVPEPETETPLEVVPEEVVEETKTEAPPLEGAPDAVVEERETEAPVEGVPEDVIEEPAPELEEEAAAAPSEPAIVVPVVPPLANVVRVESAASPEVCLTPVDSFAPPSPTGLAAVSSGDASLLTWSEVDRPDVGGYRIYRAERRQGPFSLLNDELVTAPSYTDETAVPGESYFYYVTAVDDAPARNESDPSETEEVRIAPP